MPDSKKTPQTLNNLFATFLGEFYEAKDIERKLALDSFLHQSIIVPNKPETVNNFLYNAAGRYFVRDNSKKGFVPITERGGLYNAYCAFIDSIDMSSKVTKVQEREDYKAAATRYLAAATTRSELEEERNTKIEEEIKKLEKKYKVESDASPEEKTEARVKLDVASRKFKMNFKNPALDAKIEQAKAEEDAAQIDIIILEKKYGLQGNVNAVLKAKLKCRESAKEAKNSYNMVAEDTDIGPGDYVPAIGSNIPLLEQVAHRMFKRLKVKDDVKMKLAKGDENKSEDPEAAGSSGAKGAGDDEITKLQEDYFKKKHKLREELQSTKKEEEKHDIQERLQVLKESYEEDLMLARNKQISKERSEGKASVKQTLAQVQAKARDLYSKLEPDEKLEACMDNDVVRMFTNQDIEVAKTAQSAGIGGLFWSATEASEKNKEKVKSSSSCISFESVMKVPIRYPWLMKDVLIIDFNKEEKNGDIKLNGKSFLTTPCYIIKELIIGTNMKSYLANEELRNEASSVTVKGGLSGLGAFFSPWLTNIGGDFDKQKAEIDRTQSKDGFNVPDYIMVLGYELELVGPTSIGGSAHEESASAQQEPEQPEKVKVSGGIPDKEL